MTGILPLQVPLKRLEEVIMILYVLLLEVLFLLVVSFSKVCLEIFALLHVLTFCSFFPLSGPVMNKFTIALREIGTYKEVLRSQVAILQY